MRPRRLKKPEPDPNAPVCAKCAERGERKKIRNAGSVINAVMVGEGFFYGNDGRQHHHNGSGGGRTSYSCACGHRWSEQFPRRLFPCWCGWGTEKKAES